MYLLSSIRLRTPVAVLAAFLLPFVFACDETTTGTDDDGDGAGENPVAEIAAPADGSTFAEGSEIQLEGSGTDPEDGGLTGAALEWSSDVDGTLGTGSPLTATLGVGEHVITLTATDSDGQTGTASVTVTVEQNQEPTVAITEPDDGSAFLEGESVTFTGTADDAEDGAIPAADLSWESDLDGALGTGSSITVDDLSVGQHQITFSAEDSHGATGSAAIGIEVQEDISGSLSGVEVSAGYDHSCRLTAEGAVHCWGANSYGQVGDEGEIDQSTPVVVEGAPSLAYVSVGTWYSCGLTAQGAAYCWGYNGYGRLGAGSEEESIATPTAVAGGHTFKTVSAGGAHACGITADDELYCWGWGDSGRLGNDTGRGHSATEPEAVLGGHRWQAVSAGGYHTCGVTLDGDAYCWGWNASGELGDGTTEDRSQPVLVQGDHTWQAIAAGQEHSCGITTAGEAFCWGDSRGLGNGVSIDRDTPTAVEGEHTWQAITAGDDHTCGLTSDGVAYCWGNNGNGRLGSGSSTGSDVPVAVDSGLSWAALSAGTEHTCGLSADGVAYCWGEGDNGRLGNGGTGDALSPEPVSEP